MRKIKYRAWLKTGSWMSPEPTMVSVTSLHLNTKKIVFGNKGTFGGNSTLKIDEKIDLMQSLGIEDCHKNELYEGDIIKDKITGSLKLLVFDEMLCGFGWVNVPCIVTEQVLPVDRRRIENQFELVGNKWENIGLLSPIEVPSDTVIESSLDEESCLYYTAYLKDPKFSSFFMAVGGGSTIWVYYFRSNTRNER